MRALRVTVGPLRIRNLSNVRYMSIFDGNGSDNGSKSSDQSRWGENLWGTTPKPPSGVDGADLSSTAINADPSSMAETASKIAGVVEGTAAPASAAATEALAPLSATNPGHVVMQLVEKIHVVADIPYWQSIIALTVVLRVAVLPIAIKAMRDGAKMQLLQPEMKAIQAEMMSDPFANVKQAEYEIRMKALFSKYQVTPFSMLLGPLAQMPIFLSMFFGIRQMGDYYDGFSTGGAYWFTDLAAADTTMVMPVVNSVMFLGLLELGGEAGQQQAQTDQQKTMKTVFRALGVAMVPLTMHMPSGLFVYWCSSSLISVVQNLVLKNPAIRGALDIPKVPPPGDAGVNVHGEAIKEAEIVDGAGASVDSHPAVNMDEEGVRADKSPFVKLYEENQRLIQENRRLLQEEEKRRSDLK